jgi:hypothetical protein
MANPRWPELAKRHHRVRHDILVAEQVHQQRHCPRIA